jgi:hypothetical protein
MLSHHSGQQEKHLMLFPIGTRVIVDHEAVCVEHWQDWGGPVHVNLRHVGWVGNEDWPNVVGFVTPINHAVELRDPEHSTRVVDENTGAFYMFIDRMTEGKMKEFPP